MCPATVTIPYLFNINSCNSPLVLIPWDWNEISSNPNITLEMIEKNINKIKFSNLSNNKFTFENIIIKKKEGYILLEKERSFHKLMNLYVIKNYM